MTDDYPVGQDGRNARWQGRYKTDPALRAHVNARKRERYATNSAYRAYRRSHGAKYLIDNPFSAALTYAKSRAKARSLEFSITREDILVPLVCPIMDRPFVYEKNHAMSPTLDRVDSRLGYIPGNVRVISRRANTLKSNATIEEVAAILRYMEAHHG